MNLRRFFRFGLLLFGFAAMEFLVPTRGNRNPQWCASADTIDTWQVYVDTVLVYRGPYPSPNDTLSLERVRRGTTLGIVYRTDTGSEKGGKIIVYRGTAARRVRIAYATVTRAGCAVLFSIQQLTGSLKPGEQLVFWIQFPGRIRAHSQDFLRIS